MSDVFNDWIKSVEKINQENFELYEMIVNVFL